MRGCSIPEKRPAPGSCLPEKRRSRRLNAIGIRLDSGSGDLIAFPSAGSYWLFRVFDVLRGQNHQVKLVISFFILVDIFILTPIINHKAN